MRKNILTFPKWEETAIEEDSHQPATWQAGIGEGEEDVSIGYYKSLSWDC